MLLECLFLEVLLHHICTLFCSKLLHVKGSCTIQCHMISMAQPGRQDTVMCPLQLYAGLVKQRKEYTVLCTCS